MESDLTSFLKDFSKVTKKPYQFLSVQEEISEDIKSILKKLYDYTKSKEEVKIKTALPKLIVENFDDEQVWQELELQNSGLTENTIQDVSQLSVKKDKLIFPLLLKCNKIKDGNQHQKLPLGNKEIHENLKDSKSDTDNESGLDDDDEFEEDALSSIEDDAFSDNEIENSSKKAKLKPSVVDDKFFKLAELELFLQNEEKNPDKPDKETVDLFSSNDDGPVDYKYSDFFENPDDETNEGEDEEMEHNSNEINNSEDDEKNVGDSTKCDPRISSDEDEVVDELESVNKNNGEEHNENKKKVRFSLLGSDDESSNESEDDKLTENNRQTDKSKSIKSSLEERQERLGKMIEKLEEEALSEKPWQLKGEVTANARPQNSLLEEVVDFDLSVRPAPIMTEEVTMRLEDIIKQRIKDKAWDDVERKVKPVDTPMEFKKKLALDQEKSKLSLAEVYEQEFIKQRDALKPDEGEKQEVEPPLHLEVRSMLSSLFNKLDALSNYHYTPRPVAPELKVISNVSAINMEEVAPVSTADATLLAPEEIKGRKQRGVLMSKEERTETDKKRARRLKKARQRKRQREKAKAIKEVSKINPGLGNKYSKERAVKGLLESANVTKLAENKEKIIKSSTSFFNKLQDEVKNQIKSKTSPFAKKKEKSKITAKKLKL